MPKMGNRRRLGLASVLAAAAALAAPGAVSALPYDGTNPANTVCANDAVMLKKANIYYGSIKIGEVELRHSPSCATVWSRVRNTMTVSLKAHETIVLFSTPNGDGRTEYQYPTTDTLGPNGTGWSNQYRDRPSFSAKGGLYYNGVWSWAETARSPAWTQDEASIPDSPWSCNHTTAHPCERWPTASPGVSETYLYWINSNVSALPGDSGTYDARADVRYMFNRYNAVDAPNPFMYETTSILQAEVKVYTYYEEGVYGRGGAWPEDPSVSHFYAAGEVKFSTAFTGWGPASDVREFLCHEIGHVMGLYHITEGGIKGSLATCMGQGYPTGPWIDDTTALDSIYRSAVP